MSISRSAICFSLLLGLSLFLEAYPINRAVAKIGESYITLYDILVAREFLFQDPSLPPAEALERVLTMKAVHMEYKNELPSVGEDVALRFEEGLLRKYGELKVLEERLSLFNLSLKRLRPLVEEYIAYDLMKENILLKRIEVSFADIEEYYASTYTPYQKKFGLPVRHLAEVASLIETKIRLEKKKEKEREWREEILRHYKIVSLSDPSQP